MLSWRAHAQAGEDRAGHTWMGKGIFNLMTMTMINDNLMTMIMINDNGDHL